jgi:hypothetical protein
VATDLAAYSLRLGQPQAALSWIERAIDESGGTPALLALQRRAREALLTH